MNRRMIEVVYRDGTAGQVGNDLLDVLVATGKIVRFRREEGWVDIVRDQARLRDYRRKDMFPGSNDRRAPWPKEGTGTEDPSL